MQLPYVGWLQSGVRQTDHRSAVSRLELNRADIPAEVGETLTLGFPEAPSPFDLVLSQSDDKMITWRTAIFPQQWVGTDIRWRISGGDGTSTVAFRHGTFTDETEEGRVAYVWGQVMVQLKRYVETGVATPVFVHP